ncbi:hypothetical protein BN4901_4414 [Citrobacter europaeus]|uniref:Uncharacterized protein n=1 Tax=Citrobacter europaeus TaxID=1914243 RepID=A0ABY0JW80_9ENTR|nr:hypothetical protein CIP106467_4090 [Citrobacter europaeus]SBW28044.1 hypothetical protein BN4901_4414 [Citrobacter europaeus]
MAAELGLPAHYSQQQLDPVHIAVMKQFCPVLSVSYSGFSLLHFLHVFFCVVTLSRC